MTARRSGIDYPMLWSFSRRQLRHFFSFFIFGPDITADRPYCSAQVLSGLRGLNTLLDVVLCKTMFQWRKWAGTGRMSCFSSLVRLLSRFFFHEILDKCEERFVRGALVRHLFCLSLGRNFTVQSIRGDQVFVLWTFCFLSEKIIL